MGTPTNGESPEHAPVSPLPGRLFGAAVAAAMALYYALFFFPPRLVGSNDPDRYYHLAIARLSASQGIPRTLAQAEDLGWGRYFPDKEFLLHALTGAFAWLGGPIAALYVVPLVGIGIVLVLYGSLARILPPARAAVLVLAGTLLSPMLIFRITMMRPHLLAIFFFCLLLMAILRGRSRLAAIAAAGFALSYHALYIPLIAIAVASLFSWSTASGGARRWHWATFGLICGTLLNPYFPSTLVMSWLHLKLALGVGLPPSLRSGEEVQPFSLIESMHYFGWLPASILGAAMLVLARRLKPSGENVQLWFLLALTALLTALSLKSPRASEYALPAAILLAGHCLAVLPSQRWLWVAVASLVVSQGSAAWIYYQDCWTQPQAGDSPTYFDAIAQLPARAEGRKVFNCEWEAGSYLLFARPDVRFVDLLEPAMLWQAAPAKYLARQRLIEGLERDPHEVLTRVFHADFVLCASRPLNAQMHADPRRFEQTGGDSTNQLRLYELR